MCEMHFLSDIDVRIPLVVDLDGTLILADTLLESFIRLFFCNPLAAIRTLTFVASGRAVFKRHLAKLSLPDAEVLPRRLELIDLLQAEKTRGRKIHLVTAADQKVADTVAAALGFFDSARGSDGRENLKGQRKLEYLQRQFAGGFVYAGDSAADRPVLVTARAAILCDIDDRTAAVVEEAGTPIIVALRRPPRSIRTWTRVFRAHQWSKNILIFVPLFVGHVFGEPDKIVAATLGFVILCVLASATYMVNDLADLGVDRRHQTKRLRPFASGNLPVAFGFIAAPAMVVAALAAAFALSSSFAATLFAYLALTTAYSFGLKQLPLLDVFVIGCLFTLRIVMGAEVAGLGQSAWLLSFSLSFFVSLALAKRHTEVMLSARANAKEISGRGYHAEDWPLTLTFGVGAGLVSVVIMLLYVANDAAPSGFYHRLAWLYAVPAIVSIWLMRIWLLSHRKQLHDDPVVFALKDRASLVLGLAVAVIFYLAL